MTANTARRFRSARALFYHAVCLDFPSPRRMERRWLQAGCGVLREWRRGQRCRCFLARNLTLTLTLLLVWRLHDLRLFLEPAVDSQSWSGALAAGVFGWTRMI